MITNKHNKAPSFFLVPCVFLLALCLSSCQNKAKQLLVKKWDCVKVENLAPVNKNFLTKQDSLVTAQLETALQNLSWQFNDDNSYSCSAAGITTVEGIYSFSGNNNEAILLASPNNTNYYNIVTLTEQELVLKGQGTSVPVIMHFRPH